MTQAQLRSADPTFLERLSQVLGDRGVLPPEPRYLEEPRGRYLGQAAAILRPSTTEEVAEVVRICADARVGIIPYSGGTGLVGGQVSEEGPLKVVLSFERMNAIRRIDPVDNSMVAEAGAVLADVHDAALDVNRLFPLTLASQGSARIGGLLATNAGGINVLRYGNARDLCLGLEVVLADGSIHHGLTGLIKDNMGFDLRHLLIGSEGSLGIITAASLRLFPRLANAATAWVSVPSPAAALTLLAMLRDRMGSSVSAFELIHARGLDFLSETMPGFPQPPRFEGEWMVLMEAEDGPGAELDARFEDLLESAMEAGVADDGLVAQNATQRQSFWNTRETIPEGNRLVGSIASHDISLRGSSIPEFIERGGAAIAALNPDFRINCFGHLGDGNLHYNVFPPAGHNRSEYQSQRAAVTETVHDLVDKFGGSVSAEHGVGRLKVDDLEKYGDPAKLDMMRRIKTALDPLGILNPGAMLRT